MLLLINLVVRVNVLDFIGFSPGLSLLLVLGGLGFSTDQIGTALLSVAVPVLFLQIWLYPKVQLILKSADYLSYFTFQTNSSYINHCIIVTFRMIYYHFDECH